VVYVQQECDLLGIDHRATVQGRQQTQPKCRPLAYFWDAGGLDVGFECKDTSKRIDGVLCGFFYADQKETHPLVQVVLSSRSRQVGVVQKPPTTKIQPTLVAHNNPT